MLEIISVKENSIAKALELKAGDIIESFENFGTISELDLQFFNMQKKFKFKLNTGEVFKIIKDENEELGIEVKNLNDKIEHCHNNCIFCFVNQLPKNMRETLYVKDDDYEQSFLSGNYVTLTNLKKGDKERITTLKLSPLYISVHASSSKLRQAMLKNKNAGKIIKLIKFFSRRGIKMHTQIVVCKNVNDGKILKQTLNALAKIKNVLSVAVVPVGLTCHREKQPLINAVDEECAKSILKITGETKRKNFVYASDEVYLKAKEEIPSAEFYGDFFQLENGVGLIAKMRHEFDSALLKAKAPKKKIEVGVATGVSAYEHMCTLAKKIENKFSNVKISVFLIENNTFGKTITVAGLLCGSDFIKGLNGKKLPEKILIPASCLKQGTQTFLDDLTLDELCVKLKTKLVASNSGEEFLKGVLSN